MTTLVTSGSAYTDIDAFACAIALAEALMRSDQCAIAWLPGPPNLTVPAEFHKHPAFERPCPDVRKEVILVDISDPAHIHKELELAEVTTVFDHHFGFEGFWTASTARASIEPVGAAATLIWEEVVTLKAGPKLSVAALRALACAIVSNTAGFRLPLTTSRDQSALNAIEKLLGIESDWREPYLKEMDIGVLANLTLALENDTKTVKLSRTQTMSVGQIEVHDRVCAIEGLGAMLATGAVFPDIVIVAARGSMRTSLISTQVRLIERAARFYGIGIEQQGGLYECRLPDFRLRKMILPDIQRFM